MSTNRTPRFLITYDDVPYSPGNYPVTGFRIVMLDWTCDIRDPQISYEETAPIRCPGRLKFEPVNFREYSDPVDYREYRVNS